MRKRSEVDQSYGEIGKIVESIYEIDLIGTYEKIEKDLYVGDQRSDYSTLMRHMDYAETNARNAHRLYLCGKLERERYEKEVSPIKSDMWRRALLHVQQERETWSVKKQITDGDVKASIGVLFEKEYQEIEEKLSKLKATEEHLEMLAELSKIRCKSLQTMLYTLRK
jgi:hypothetical protein